MSQLVLGKFKPSSIKINIYIYVLLFVTFLFVGCSVDNQEGRTESITPFESENTLIMYVLAENNLSGHMVRNVADAVTAMSNDFPNENRLVIYYDGIDNTVLFELYSVKGEKMIKRVLKTYSKQYSTNPEVMKGVFNDIKELAPSDNYSVVIAGHGNGWFPKKSDLGFHLEGGLKSLAQMEFNFTPTPEAQLTRAYYYDSDKDNEEGAMSPLEMVEGLSPIKFDYILFDLCFMSSIEFLYDLRHSADYIIASPTEILSAGFPFLEIIPLIVGKNGTPAEIANTFVEFYRNRDTNPSGSCAVIKCSAIDALAESIKVIYNGAFLNEHIDIMQVQPLERMRGHHAFFDMKDYIRQLCTDDVLYANYLTAFNNMVIFNGHTDIIYSALGSRGNISVKGDKLDLCGVSTYISRFALPVTEAHYRETAWAKFTNPPKH